MSAQGDITDFLRGYQPDSEKGYVPLTPEQVAQETGISREKVNKTMYNLMSRGKIEVVRGPNKRSIIGYRNVDLSSGRRTRAAAPPPVRERNPEPVMLAPSQPRPIRSVATPALDEYAQAKVKFRRLVDELGPLISATFEENRYAEEGLRLRDRLAAIEPSYADLRKELDEANRDLKALRGRLQSDMAASALKNGAMVQSGD